MINKQFILALIAASVFITGCKKDKAPEYSENNRVDIADTAAASPAAPAQPKDTIQQYDEEQEGTPQEECFEKSGFTLPYNRTISPAKAAYKILPCEIEGVEEFLCNSRGLRYIPLPDYGKVDVILVPMDCGDFSYRYFLLTVKDKKVVASQYAEGEWFEPGDEQYKEITRFSVDRNYKITIVTNASENGAVSLKETLNLQLMPDGKLKKL